MMVIAILFYLLFILYHTFSLENATIFNLTVQTPQYRQLSRSMNIHPRYKDITVSQTNLYQSNKLNPNYLLVFIAITSSPTHSHLRQSARNTWILPCIISNLCDYKFFIDVPKSKITISLVLEIENYNDIILRESCSLMDGYNDEINYGNAPPIRQNEIFTDHVLSFDEEVSRIFYKINWKVRLGSFINPFAEQQNYC